METQSPRQLPGRLLDDPSLVGLWQDVRMEPGQHLFRQGEPGDAFYTLIDGRLEVYQSDDEGRRVVLARLGGGASVGELALLDGGVRTASVVCVAESELKRLRRDDFLESLKTCPELSELTISILGERMRRNTDHVRSLTQWARMVAHGDYDEAREEILGRASQSDDEDGVRFAQTFTGMIDAVREREDELRRELDRLRIEIDEARSEKRVAEITEDEFFKSLQGNANDLRRRIRGESG